MVIKDEYTKDELVSIIKERCEELYTYTKAKLSTVYNYKDTHECIFFCANTATNIVEDAVKEAKEEFKDCHGLFILLEEDGHVIRFRATSAVQA